MRTSSDKLFQLIHRLTKSEKRYFKLFAQLTDRKDGSNYIKLFDAIEAQKKYDEEAIKKNNKDEAFIEYLSASKAYLYKLILRSLNVYGSGHDYYEQMLEYFMIARILYKKNMFDEASHYTKKAREIAYKGEWFGLLIEIEKLQRQINSKQLSAVEIEKENWNASINKILALETEIIESINFYDYVYLKRKKANAVRNKKELLDIEKKIHLFNINHKQELKTITAKRLKKSAQAEYFYLQGDFEKYYKKKKASLDLIELQKEYKKDEYKKACISFLYSCSETYKFNEAKIILTQLEAFKTTYSEWDCFFEKSLFWLYIHLHLNQKEFNESYRYVIEKEKEIFDMWESAPDGELMVGALNATAALIIKKDYTSAIRWLNKFFFMKNIELKERYDLIGKASLMYMITHFELRNDELNYRSVKPIQKQLNDLDVLNPFEIKATEFIGRVLVKAESNKSFKEEFIYFKQQIEILKNEDENEAKYIDSLLFTDWIESKIKGVSLEKYLVEKTNANFIIEKV